MKPLHKHLKILMFAIVLLVKTLSLSAQQEASNWYFGDGQGLDFNCSPPRQVETGKFHALEGSAIISDECGEVVVYTNGDTLYTGSNIVVAGATNLSGDRRATQSSLIIKKPGSSSNYYVFTNDADENNNLLGLKYSELNWLFPNVNMISQNKNMVVNNREMLTAVNDNTGLGVWIITKLKTNEFNAFNVSISGVDSIPVVSTVNFNSSESGQLKASPQGNLLVMRNPLKIFSFDNTTGKISELFELKNSFLTEGNSIEFSPNGKKLYVNNFGGSTTTDGLYQFDLSSLNKTDIENSARKVSGISSIKGGLQLAPNGNIYYIADSSDRSIGSIENVNDTITRLKVTTNAYTYLNVINSKYLPNFNQSYFDNVAIQLKSVCQNDETGFKLIAPYNKLDSVKWEFDDAISGSKNVSNDIEPLHRFTAPGCYNIKTYAYKNGKTTIIKQRIKINKLPTTNLPKDTTICKDPKILNLNAAVFGESPATYLWNGYDQNFYKSISEPGTYWLTKTYKCCEVTDTIHVFFDSLNVDFEINDLIQCENDPKQNFKFKSTAVLHNGGKITWDLGNGKSATGDSAEMTYPNYGFYYISIYIRSNSGCSKSGVKPIIVLKKPEAKFYIDTLKQCFVGNKFNIIDSSSLQYGMGLMDTVHFNFGDNTISKNKKISKTYLSPNKYQIQLIASSDQQCYDTIVKNIQVFENPKAGFIIEDSIQCLVGNKFLFTDTTHTKDDIIKSHIWNYGNGTIKSLDSLKSEFIYSHANKYNVKLIATTVNGCKDSVIKPIIVNPNPNVFPQLIKDSMCFENNLYQFSAKNISNKSKLTQFIWNWGDSTFANDSIATKHYFKQGDFLVTYTARTDQGCSDSSFLNVHVIPSPTAVISSSDTIPCFNKNEVQFDGRNSYSDEGNVESYYWDFANGNNSQKEVPELQLYTNPTPINVMLVVESSKKCRDTVYQHIKFLAQPKAILNINKNEDCLNNNNIFMDGSSSVSSTGFIKKYYWFTGDGTIDSISGKSLKYKYKDTGEYNITLVAKSNENCFDTVFQIATIFPNPVTDFIVSEACLSHPNKFTDQSTITKGIITKWIWKLDNGTIDSSGPVISFEYSNAGNYGVSLKTISDKDCETQVYKKDVIIVKPIPKADFDWAINDLGLNQTELILTNKSLNAIEYNWYADGMFFSDDENTKNNYTDTITTHIILYAKHPSGCFDSISKSIFIAPEYIMYIPNAFTPNGDDLNEVFQPITNKFLNRFEMLIYNRWGELIFKTDNPQIGWDGTFKGEFAPLGPYVYLIFAQDIRNQIFNYKGTINLLR